MAVLNFGGLETGDMTEAANSAGTVSVVTSPVRTGTYALRVNPTIGGAGSYRFEKVLSTTGLHGDFAVANAYARFYFRYATKPSANSEEIAKFGTATGVQKSVVRINSAGNLILMDSGNVTIGTSTTALVADTWYRIDFLGGTGASGTAELRINGVVEVNGTGNLGTANNARFTLGKHVNQNSETVDFFYDDVQIADSAYPGEGEVHIMIPNANGNYQVWTIGAGSGTDHFDKVDEVPPESDGTDATYLLSTLTLNDGETEDLQDSVAAGIIGQVFTAKAVLWVKRDGAANGAIRVRIRSGSTDSDTSADGSTVAAYAFRGKINDTDPATGNEWTAAGLDAVEVGLIERSTANKSRVTFMAIMVDSGVPIIGNWLPQQELPKRRKVSHPAHGQHMFFVPVVEAPAPSAGRSQGYIIG